MLLGRSTFGGWLRERRRMLDLTQAELARRVGCSEITIRKIEANDRIPSRQIAELLAGMLDIPSAERATFVAFARGRPAPSAPHPAGPAVQGVPAPLTRLLGREQAAAAIARRLLDEEVRLLTLVGPPGIGKTRLALHVAAELGPQFPDGARFVPLAALADAQLVLEAVAQAAGVGADAGRALADQLVDALRERALLLVLDNFEHVLPAASEIAQLLTHCPRLTVLATSRAALHVRGEQLFPVAPLALPPPCGPLDAAQVASSPAVQLFVERTQAVAPHFALSADNAPAVAAICARLDGLPLAIELVAARCRLLSPAALLARLAELRSPLQLLTQGPGDLPPRHRALGTAIAWSYGLLTPWERQVFRRLGVFAGSFDAPAALAVCGDDPAPVEDGLASLIKQSLLQTEPQPGGGLRFSMLQTLREYALEQLGASGELAAVRARHAAHYAALAQSLERAPTGAAQERLIGELQPDENNLRAALEWFVEHDGAAGVSCAAALRHFWLARGALHEGRAWMTRLLATGPAQAIDSLRAQALATAGFLAYHQGDHRQAEALAGESLTLYRRIGDREAGAEALLILGRAVLLQSRLAEAEALAGESLALYRAQGNLRGAVEALRSLALAAKDRGDWGRAAQLCEECLQLYRQTEDARGTARTLFNLSTIAYWQGDFGRSGELARQAAEIFQELDDRMGLAYAIEGIGMVAFQQAEYVEATRQLTRSHELLRTLGDTCGMALVRHELGVVARARGERPEARRLHCEALRLAWECGDLRRVAFCLEGLAACADAPLTAARLFGAAEALRDRLGSPLPDIERAGYASDVAAARAGAEAASFAAAWDAGRAEPIARIIEEACRLEPCGQ